MHFNVLLKNTLVEVLECDQKVAHAIKVSLDEDEAEENYLRFYALRNFKQNDNEDCSEN